MNFLLKVEEIILLSDWKLKDKVYGTVIIEQVEKIRESNGCPVLYRVF